MSSSSASYRKERQEYVRARIPMLDHIDMQVTSLGPGFASVLAPAGKISNHLGMAYAGALFSVAEVLGGLIPDATWKIDGFAPVVGKLEISFLRPAMGGIEAHAELSDDEVNRVGRELAAGASKVRFALETMVHDHDGERGELVATTRGEYQVRSFSLA